jgi:hypothetical protein
MAEAANANTTMPPQPAATPPGASVGALNAASTLGEFVASHQGVGAVASLDMAEARVEEGAVLRHSPTLGSAPGSLLDESPRSPPSPPLPSVVNSSGRAAELWGRARAAMADGRLHSLGVSEQYSVVSAVFSAVRLPPIASAIIVWPCQHCYHHPWFLVRDNLPSFNCIPLAQSSTQSGANIL